MNLRLCNYVPSSPNEDEFFSKENIKRVSTPNTRPDATELAPESWTGLILGG